MLSPFILCPDKFRHVKTVQTAQTLLNPFILCPDKFRRANIVKMYKDKEVKKCQGCFFCQCVT
jgi:hypothetical protein